jgi:hypothetical protein
MSSASFGRLRTGLARLVPAAVAVFAAFALRDFLEAGIPGRIDGHSHVARVWFTAQAFAEARYPSWTNAWYGGCQPLAFHSPGWFWLAGLAGAIAGDPLAPSRWLLWAAQIGGALGLYAFVLRIARSPLLGAFAALLLVGCPSQAAVLGFNGNHPTALVYLLLPILLWHGARVPSGPGAGRRFVAGQALLLGALFLGHLPNAVAILPAVLACQVHAALAAGARAPARWPRPVGRLAAAAPVAAALGLAALLVSGLLVSALRQAAWVTLSLDAGQPVRGAGLAGLRIVAGLAPADWIQLPYLRSHGPLWFALGAIGALLSLHPRQRHWRPVASGLLVSLACVALLDQRAAIGVSFFLYPLCAAAVLAVMRLGFVERRSLAAVPALLAIAGALIAMGGQPRQVKRIEPDTLEVYARIPAGPTASRTFDVSRSGIGLDGFYGPSALSPWISGRAIPFGAFPQAAALGLNPQMALASRLKWELQAPQPRLSEASLDVLYLQHVEFLVDRSERSQLARLSASAGLGEHIDERILRLRHASPALFSARLEGLPAALPAPERPGDPGLLAALEQRWRQRPGSRAVLPSLEALLRSGSQRDWPPLAPLVDAMGIERGAARAERIFSRHAPAQQPARGAGPAVFAVTAQRESPTAVEVSASSSQAGFVRLAYSHAPVLEVRLDGEPVASVADALGAVVLPFPAGAHTISLAAPGAPVAGLSLAAGVALLLLALLLAPRARRLRSTPNVRGRSPGAGW